MSGSRANVHNTVVDNSNAGGTFDFGQGVDSNQLWFQQNGNDLQITVLGTNDNTSGVNNMVTIPGFFASATRTLVTDVGSRGGLLADSQIQQLVGSMASFAASNPGFNPATANALPDDRVLQGTIVASWHH